MIWIHKNRPSFVHTKIGNLFLAGDFPCVSHENGAWFSITFCLILHMFFPTSFPHVFYGWLFSIFSQTTGFSHDFPLSIQLLLEGSSHSLYGTGVFSSLVLQQHHGFFKTMGTRSTLGIYLINSGFTQVDGGFTISLFWFDLIIEQST